VREVAAGRTTVSEIANGAEVSVPNLTKMLHRLVELGYLEARAPLSPRGPEARRTSYRPADPFFRFWLPGGYSVPKGGWTKSGMSRIPNGTEPLPA
jgi:IclR helix-turn-helix domain